MGINEINTEGSGTTLYNSVVYIGADGAIAGKHRKLIPTGGERLVHAQGDGSTLRGFDTRRPSRRPDLLGELHAAGALTMYARASQIYVAPTWDSGEPWISTLRHIAKEGRCYVSAAAPRSAATTSRSAALQPTQEWINPGDSAVVDPDGKFVAGPLQRAQEILYAEIDPVNDCVGGPRFQIGCRGALREAGRVSVDGRPGRSADHPLSGRMLLNKEEPMRLASIATLVVLLSSAALAQLNPGFIVRSGDPFPIAADVNRDGLDDLIQEKSIIINHGGTRPTCAASVCTSGKRSSARPTSTATPSPIC